MERLGAVLGGLGILLGRFDSVLEGSWAVWGAFGRRLGSSWGHLGSVLGCLGSFLGRFVGGLEASWAHVVPEFVSKGA